MATECQKGILFDKIQEPVMHPYENDLREQTVSTAPD